MLEGRREDIIVPGEGEQIGRVESALSHVDGDEEGSVFGDHHEDDIVEHLDVVGTSYYSPEAKISAGTHPPF